MVVDVVSSSLPLMCAFPIHNESSGPCGEKSSTERWRIDGAESEDVETERKRLRHTAGTHAAGDSRHIDGRECTEDKPSARSRQLGHVIGDEERVAELQSGRQQEREKEEIERVQTDWKKGSSEQRDIEAESGFVRVQDK